MKATLLIPVKTPVADRFDASILYPIDGFSVRKKVCPRAAFILAPAAIPFIILLSEVIKLLTTVLNDIVNSAWVGEVAPVIVENVPKPWTDNSLVSIFDTDVASPDIELLHKPSLFLKSLTLPLWESVVMDVLLQQ